MKKDIEINQPVSKFQDQSISPMHTAEHILNQTMMRMFGCERSKNTHIERKKSKCDYLLFEEPTSDKITAIEEQVNKVIKSNLPVNIALVNREDVPLGIDLSKLPEEASQVLRLVSIGDYDLCPCIGEHVKNTSEIGGFKITTYDYSEGRLRIRYKLNKPADII